MRRVRKVTLGLLFGAFACLVILGLLELFLPRLINLNAVHESVFAELRRRIQCEIVFERADFTLFPWPHVVVRRARIWRPESFDVSTKSVTLYPRLLPLFSGKIEVHRILFEKPDIQLFRPAGSSDGAALPDPRAEMALLDRRIDQLAHLDQLMADQLDFLRFAPIAPQLEITDGRLTILRNGEAPWIFSGLDAHGERSPGHFELALGGESNVSERFSIKVILDLSSGTVTGQVMVVGAKLDLLGSPWLSGKLLHWGPSTSSLAVEYAYDPAGGLHLELQGSIPELSLRKGDRAIRLAGATFNGSLQLGGGTATFSLSSLKLDTPHLNASGELRYEREASIVELDLEGREVDVAGVREVVLGVAGENKSVGEVFDVVRGGFVPLIHYKVRGQTFRELDKLQNTVIQGSMEQGTIYIPPAGIEVVDARGDVEIVNGILKAGSLEGRLGESRAAEGSLILALKKDAHGDGPFHLDLQLDADLGQLPPVLRRTVKDADFQRELALMEDIGGHAVGRVVLGESLKSVKTLVEAGSFELHGRYGRVPFPIRLKGDGLRYEGKTLSAQGLRGTVGQSSFEPLILALDWGEPSRIELTSGSRARIHLDEVHPWLMSYARIQRALKAMESLKGNLLIQEVSVSGPLRSPEQWQYNVEAMADDVLMRHSFFPDTVLIKAGKVQSTPGRLLLSGCRTSLLDAAVEVSGSLTLHKGDLSGTDLLFNGAMGSKALQWITNRVQLPQEFRPRPPAALSNARFSWLKEGQTTFSAGVSLSDGTKAELDLRTRREELIINRLAVKDQVSDAAFSILIQDERVDLTFEGVLNGSTLDKALLENTLLSGSMKGTFRASILPDSPMSSTARGDLELKGLKLAWKKRPPLEIQHANLHADGNRLSVQTARLYLRESELNFKGEIDFSQEGFLLNLDLAAGSLVWEEIRELREREMDKSGKSNEARTGATKAKSASVRGVLRVKSDHLYWEGYHFAPVQLRVDFRPEGTSFEFLEATLCGISCPARINVTSQNIRISADLAAKDAELDPTLACLWERQGVIDGSYVLRGALEARGTEDELLSSLRGKLDFTARDGRIFPIGVIGKIFSVLNITEIYRGRIPDLTRKGCAYDSITATGAIDGGILSLDNCIVNAHCMKMVWHGTIDLMKKEVDLVAVVAPLRTVDRIIDKVPILGDMLNGSLISFPVRVSGKLSDPEVIPLSPSALGAGFLDFLKRTIQVPIRLMEPLR